MGALASPALERFLVEHGAPTLAGLKTASLFCFPLESGWRGQVLLWQRRLGEKGLALRVLRLQGDRALLYLYRPAQLQRDLLCPGAARFLAGYGYEDVQVEAALSRLAARLRESPGFPHEIGLFLGYPLGDVVGFIQNKGKNCKCSGCWKVYCDELEARRRFAKIQKCRQVYARLWSQGRTVWQLTVAAQPAPAA